MYGAKNSNDNELYRNEMLKMFKGQLIAKYAHKIKVNWLKCAKRKSFRNGETRKEKRVCVLYAAP